MIQPLQPTKHVLICFECSDHLQYTYTHTSASPLSLLFGIEEDRKRCSQFPLSWCEELENELCTVHVLMSVCVVLILRLSCSLAIRPLVVVDVQSARLLP